LFSLAGFYWRLKGNTYQAIECYRRAAHFAPLLYKDVAYIALANVMLDIEALEEAAIFARAAVDIRPHEVGVCSVIFSSHYQIFIACMCMSQSSIGEFQH